MIINSPNSAALIAAPVPGGEPAAPRPAAEADGVPGFMRRAWGVLLAAVLPLWRDPALMAAHGEKIVQARRVAPGFG